MGVADNCINMLLYEFPQVFMSVAYTRNKLRRLII